ncbi:GGDEF domain-containing protein [Oxalicibacterium faecigallinarum]|uniref:diguanylate cyclase n=1 Tax=Oxalicibacterium faecigallinarum TaxID=573741 RepID=A0A8J3ATQ8_9BURK|nr:sensor domain-containing diguanylate cyclase [Oxalicibacterium faecigallinarum]GGI15978.1 GGDEF domain-containing protein [Oxalicibacterium faecigallinarum]
MFNEQQLRAILTALPDPAFILTRSGRYAAIYGGADARYYHDGSALIGKYMHEVLHDEKSNWFSGEINKALASRKLHIVEYGLAASDVRGLETAGPSEQIWFEGRIQALDFQVSGEDAVLWVASNITARNDLEVKLRMQSESDSLTGLINRRKLLDVLAAHYDIFCRYQTPATLFMFDIDDFKTVNDQHGHMKGDVVLQTIANVCRAELRATDHAARVGGDEFVVLMPHTRSEDALPIVERLRQCIASAVQQLGIKGAGTISGGFSELMADDSSFTDVKRRADQALYNAKRAGRNQVLAYVAD